MKESNSSDRNHSEIAIIGMACRFPGAQDVETFWQNLQNGVESITFFSDEELLATGVPPELLKNPNYVKGSAVLDHIDQFDASFFGYTPREAEIMDPQHRLFLECAHQALESAGIVPEIYDGTVGVYAGTGMNTYLLNNIYPNHTILEWMGGFQTRLANDKDFLTTRVSYKLDLKGPSLNIQTACSTSLVAVHLACQNLLNGECDIALAGGASINVPHRAGYLYDEGMIDSPDGHCRVFDAQAQGTVGGSGVGIVVLKRLVDALEDGDDIHAVVKGSAVNNDGALKVGFTAPSVDGQTRVVAEAIALAEVDVRSITYVEAHGTGTILGDPIEVAALTQAFRTYTEEKNFCALGSVKTNLGHLDTAAGVAGLIKTVLALKHKYLPPSLHFKQPNPKIDFANSPFFVNHTLQKWESPNAPRRAGVSSFGIGGTNAHLILEEAPLREPSDSSRPWQLIPLSAKSFTALETMRKQLGMYLEQHMTVPLADVAHTLQKGRVALSHRHVFVCREVREGIENLERPLSDTLFSHFQESETRSLAFMFSGQGTQYVHMGQELYQHEPVFRRVVDHCAVYLIPILGADIRQVLYPHNSQTAVSTLKINQTAFTQPILFTIEYALAQLWLSWGVRPQAMIGHSIGEYVAACLADVFSLENALSIVATRGKLVQQLPEGDMCTVPLPANEISPLLGPALSIAAINAPSLCVVSGPRPAMQAFQAELTQQEVEYTVLHTSHAFHSNMMLPILDAFTQQMTAIPLHPPQIPIISNVTGAWLATADAINPAYWVDHLRQTVLFAKGVQTLQQTGNQIMIEVGPGRTLCTIAAQNMAESDQSVALPSLPHPKDPQSDLAFLLTTVGKVWLLNGSVDWSAFHTDERRHHLTLPTYPFERQSYWIHPPTRQPTHTHSQPEQKPTAAPPPLEQPVNLSPRVHSQVAPRNEVEEKLASVWRQLLNITNIGVYDNFFNLNGHSLLATQLISRVRKLFAIEIPISQFFAAPTIAELAIHITAIQANDRDHAQSTLPPIEIVSRENALPLSFAQQRLWFLDQFEPNSPFYNLPTAVRLTGRLDLAALQQSFNIIIQRHEVLRTAFVMGETQPHQIISPTLTIPLPLINLQHLSPADQETELIRQLAEKSIQPFHLAHPPLLRTALFHLTESTFVLFINKHHIISDEWSTSILVHELTTIYRALATNTPTVLPDLPIQYADFAYWQRQWLQGDRLVAQLAYWQQQLTSPLPTLSLPVDRPRPSVQTFRGATYVFKIPLDLTQALNRLSQQEGVTLFMTLLAAFQVLLHRYTNQTDILVGSPIANRNHYALENLIGFFINTLVLRSDLTGNPPFSALLKQVKKITLGAYAHQDLPFEKLLDELNLERDLSRTPLFEVMFVLQNTPPVDVDIHLPNLVISPIDISSQTSQFDLTLSMTETAAGMTGVVEYNSDLFDAATIQRMMSHFHTLLSGIVENRDRAISDLPLLTSPEFMQLTVNWNATQAVYAADLCIHTLFERQVQKTPQATAVVFGEQQLTYQALNQKANQLAHHLQTIGVGTETLVAVCVDRSLEMVIALLGILKAGGAYVPLDPAYPQKRLAFMLSDSQSPVLLTQSHLLAQLSEHQAQTIYLDIDWPTIAKHNCQEPNTAVQPQNLAYVIYTSGSTGQPKGAMNTHQALNNRLNWMQKSYQLTDADRILQKTPFSFDVSVWEFFWPLLQGATLVMAKPEGHKDTRYLSQLIKAENITTLHFVPSMLQVFIAENGLEQCTSLKNVVCSGEALPASLQEAFWANSGAKLHNLYGPTEAAIDVTSWYCQPGTGQQAVPIGKPIDNIQIYLLDKNGHPVPIGVTGELHIGGDGLSRGYHQRPALTAEKFVPDPFSSQPGRRLYRSGDLARFFPNGNIQYLGRMDFQVKIRGFRIELGEIETALSQQTAVREVALLTHRDDTDHKRLIAYLVGNPIPDETLRHTLKQTLPDYMIPARFLWLDKMPLLPNGKVNRHALPAPDTSRPDLATTFIPPRTKVEATLTQIWTQVLHLDKVGIHDNFFGLGGDSILSIQVIVQLQQAGLHLTPRQLFQHQTIAELATVAEVMPDAIGEQDILTGPVDLLPIQRWFLKTMTLDHHHFNQAILLTVTHPLQPTWLAQSMHHLWQHHDALRLRFVQTNEGWQQHYAPMSASPPFVYEDLSQFTPAEQAQRITAATIAAQSSLNLNDGPLCQLVYFHLGAETDNRLLLVAHHLVIDGFSWWILLTDLYAVYQQISQDTVVILPQKTTSLKQWAARLTTYAQTPQLEEEVTYWQQVRQNNLPSLPRDKATGDNIYATARTISVSLSREETKSLLQEVPAAYRTRINDVLLTAVAQAFSQWTGQSRLLIDLEGHGREDLFDGFDLSRTVGWFTILYPVCLDIADYQGEGPQLMAVKEQLRRIPNNGLGYGVLRYLAHPTIRQRLAAGSQSEILFNYLGQREQPWPEDAPFQIAAEAVGPLRSPHAQRPYLIELNGSVDEGKFYMDWTYSEAIHHQATVKTLAHAFIQALQALINHCLSPGVGDFTPSDFEEFDGDKESLADLMDEIRKSVS